MMDNIFQVLDERLKGYADLRIDKTCGSITVLPRYGNGFTVSLLEQRLAYFVYFNGWVRGFGKNEKGLASAVNLFLFGLSGSCRLIISSADDVDYEWKVEYFEDGKWCPGLSSKRRIYGSQNNISTRCLSNSNTLSDDLKKYFILLVNDTKRYNTFFYIIVCLVASLFFIHRNSGWSGFVASYVFFFPIAFIPLVLVFNWINCWFDQRGKRLTSAEAVEDFKITVNRTFPWFSILWTTLWIIIIFIGYMNFGDDIVGILILTWPFMLCAFFIPLFIMYSRIIR